MDDGDNSCFRPGKAGIWLECRSFDVPPSIKLPVIDEDPLRPGDLVEWVKKQCVLD